MLPDANLVAISVPGAYAKFEAMKAIKHGLHVFLFSDNVPVQDEIELKTEAVRRGVLCMGPDCGTAYLNGMGVGFTNVAPRGRIGFVAAAGTGLQAVVSRVAALGEGVSHGIGVGGRDLSAEVGGMMTLFALEALADDPSTEAIVIISKPPHPTVLPRLEAAIAEDPQAGGGVRAGRRRAAAERGRRGSRRSTPPRMRRGAAHEAGLGWPTSISGSAGDPDATGAAPVRAGRSRREVLGLYTGGTLAHETHLLLESLLGHDGAAPDPRSGRRSIHRGPAPPHDRPADPDGHDSQGGSGEGGGTPGGPGAGPRIASQSGSASRGGDTPGIRHGRGGRSAVGRGGIGRRNRRRPAGPRESDGPTGRGGNRTSSTNAEAARFAALLVKRELADTLLEVSR